MTWFYGELVSATAAHMSNSTGGGGGSATKHSTGGGFGLVQYVGGGWPACRSWEALPTLEAFRAGVTRAIVFTPLFCLATLAIFVGGVVVCYGAMYSIALLIAVVLYTLRSSYQHDKV